MSELMARSTISLARNMFKEGKGEATAQKRAPTLAAQFRTSVNSVPHCLQRHH